MSRIWLNVVTSRLCGETGMPHFLYSSYASDWLLTISWPLPRLGAPLERADTVRVETKPSGGRDARVFLAQACSCRQERFQWPASRMDDEERDGADVVQMQFLRSLTTD